MRYSEWDGEDNDGPAGGHRVVTTVISQLGLDKYSVPFNESTNPLFYLRTKNMYLNDITSDHPAPYNVDHYGADDSPDTGIQSSSRTSPVTATTAAADAGGMVTISTSTAASPSSCRRRPSSRRAICSRTSATGT